MQKLVVFFLFFIGLEISALTFLTYSKNSRQKPAFVDILDASGIKREVNLKGAAWADVNNDGFLDLLLVGENVKLYRNNGNGTFTDITEKSGLAGKSAMGGFFGDYDNDGCEDLFLTSYAPGTGTLYDGNCDGTFRDVTQKAGINVKSSSQFGAAWGDYDNSGYLSLYIANYGHPLRGNDDNKVTGYKYEENILYHNNGNGTFTNVIKKAGVSGVANCSFSVKNFKRYNWSQKESYQPIWFDYDNDGKIDLFITTDDGVSPLYKNNGDGTFEDVTNRAGLCREGTGMGVSVGDLKNDGNMDIYVTNTGANYFWHNNGNGTFTELGAELKIADPRTIGWGSGFFDFNNDGFLDLYVANGTVLHKNELQDPEVGKIKLDKLYKNNGNGTFSEVAAEMGISGDYPKGAAAFGDYNNDGFVDLVVLTNHTSFDDSRIKLYKNQGNQNHWLTIQLKGTKSNRDGIGARITLRSGGKTQIRDVIAGSSFLSQNSLWQTFGLGKESLAYSVEIKWPSGTKQVLNNIKADQKLVVTEKAIDK